MGLLATFAQYTTDYNYSYDYGTTTTSGSSMPAGVLAVLILFYVAIIVFMIIALWKVYAKAGRPGWAAIVPVYNTWVLFEIVGYPGWWAILAFVPFVNIFPAIMVLVAYFKLAKLFGKGDGFAVCTILFPIVTIPILGFGKAQFQGTPVAASAAPQPQAPVVPQAPVYPAAPEQAAPVAQPAPSSEQTPPTPPQPPVVQ